MGLRKTVNNANMWDKLLKKVSTEENSPYKQYLSSLPQRIEVADNLAVCDYGIKLY